MRRNILITVLVLAVFFQAALINSNLKQKQVLEMRVSEVSQERSNLTEKLNQAQELINSLEKSLSVRKEELLKEQAEAKNLKEELINAKEDINELTQEINSVKNLKAEREEELRVALEKFEEFKRSKQLPMKERITELFKSLKTRNKELAALKHRLAASEKTCFVLAENNKSLVEGSKELEPVRLKLFDELQDARNQLLKQGEKLIEQGRLLEELNTINQGFKEQVERFSEVLTKRELELAGREKEGMDLKRKVLDLESKRADLESQLSAFQNEQKRTVNLLNEVTQLNTALQEKLTQFSSLPKEEGGKEKTEDLKRKVEVILNSTTP